ncbi:ubiquitin carrier protein [Naviculisporaceae sp. PSN 640]
MVAHTLIPFVGGHLAKRFYEEPEKVEITPLMALATLANILFWIIPLIWLSYTLGSLIPALAMIEDPNPPAYEPLTTNDNDVETAGQAKNGPGIPGDNGKPITSSIRATQNLLGNVGGWWGRFRGFWPAAVAGFASSIVNGIFVGAGAPPMLQLGAMVASLALVQLNTAWVHIIMTPPNPLPFWRRLPPLRRTFEATCFPVLVNWAAKTAAVVLPLATAAFLGLKIWDPKNPGDVPRYEAGDAGKTFIVWLVSFVAHWVLVLPCEVALVRVQASLLSPEEPTIIPFDTTFKGKVGPAVVDGKGYLTMRDALSSFSRADWLRFFKLYIKIFFISVAAVFAFLITMVLQALLFSAVSPSRSAPSNPPQ